MKDDLIEEGVPACIFWLNEFDQESQEKLIKDFDLNPEVPNLVAVLHPNDDSKKKWVVFKDVYPSGMRTHGNEETRDFSFKINNELPIKDLPDSPVKKMLEDWVSYLNQ